MGNWVCFTFFKPNVSQRLFTLCYSLSLALCHHSPAIPSIALWDHVALVSPTLFHHSPSPVSIRCRCRYSGLCCTHFEPSLYPLPLITGTLLCRFTVLCCICFVGNGWLSEGDLALPKYSIFFHLFCGYDAGLGFVWGRKYDNKC